MAKSWLSFSLDVEYTAVGKLIDDLRHREGIVAINLIDDRREKKISSPEYDAKSKHDVKSKQTFSGALLQTLYTQGPQTKDGLRDILTEYHKNNAHFSQTLSYLRTTGRTSYADKTGIWDLSKQYRLHVAKRLGGDVIISHKPGDLMALPKPNGSTHTKKSKMTGGELILKLLMAKQAPMNRTEMRSAFVKDGRSKKSIGDQLSKLVKVHKIKRVDTGTYTLA